MTDELDRLIDQTVDEIAQIETEEPVFEAPWQARGFALAVALRQQDHVDWLAFQQHLSNALEATQSPRADESAYYESWVDALESILMDTGTISREELDDRTSEFASGHRDASEFVAGVEHSHSHSHEH
jgi:nitrile hydratase accessory protein